MRKYTIDEITGASLTVVTPPYDYIDLCYGYDIFYSTLYVALRGMRLLSSKKEFD